MVIPTGTVEAVAPQSSIAYALSMDTGRVWIAVSTVIFCSERGRQEYLVILFRHQCVSTVAFPK